MPSTRYLLSNFFTGIGLISAMEINTEFQTWWRPIEKDLSYINAVKDKYIKMHKNKSKIKDEPNPISIL